MSINVTYNDGDESNAELTLEQRQRVAHTSELWRRAHSIASQHPDLDVSDVYHSLRCLELTPTERLANALRRGRLRAYVR